MDIDTQLKQSSRFSESDARADGRPSPLISAAPAASPGVVRNALLGSVWTMMSRLTGLGETITVGAVLGASYLGNTYQAVNSLPNLVYYQLLAGSLFASLLVPPLVTHLDRGDIRRAEVLVGGFLGRLLLLALLASSAILIMGHLIVRLLTLAVTDPSVASAQQHVGWLFLIMFVPQIALYAVAGTWGAVQNADGRFALAAAAPTFENIGLISTLVTAGVVFGVANSIEHVSRLELLVLGLGTTASVAVHASVQRWGARSTAIRFRPSSGWRDPEVRVILRRIPPALAYTGLAASQIVAILVVANRLAGGLVTFQLALNFFYLPTAIVTWPVARAVLPELSRAHLEGDDARFRDELVRAVRLASFISVPMAVAYLTLSLPIARAVTVGALANPRAVHLVAISLRGVAIGVVGETWFVLGTYAFYGRQNVRAPLASMAVRAVVFVAILVAAWSARGDRTLVMLGVCVSGASVAGAVHAGAQLRRKLPRGDLRLAWPLLRTFAAAAAMAVPVSVTAWALQPLAHAEIGELALVLATAAVGLACYLGVQALLRAPELSWLRTNILRPSKGIVHDRAAAP